MSEDSNRVDRDLKFSLPQIQVTHPKTRAALLVAIPKPGALFDLRIPKNITRDELLVCVADLVEFHYKHCIGTQKRLYDMGFGAEQVGELFFPNVPHNRGVEEEAEEVAAKNSPGLKVVKDEVENE